MRQSDEFFAAVKGDLVAGVLHEKVEDWVKTLQTTSQYKRMHKAWAMYYGMTNVGGVTSSEIKEAGPRGEYSLIMMNHFRNFVQHLLVLTTSQRPEMECQAANTDSESMEQCILGNGLLDWYLREKKVERYLKDATESAIALSEGFVGMDWEPTMGEMYATNPQGNPVYEGDISISKYSPIDVVRDIWRNDAEMPWGMTIKWKNKFNLAAKYQDMEDEILNVDAEELWNYRQDFLNKTYNGTNDLIPEFTFYHEKCEALPQGRMVKFLSSDVKLLDAPLPVNKIPLFRVSASDQFNTIFGYTPAFDLLGPQEALNLVDSSMLTSIKTFGVGCIKLPEGHNVQHTQIADGLSALVINEKGGKAEPMNFLSIPPALPAFRESVLVDMERISGVNSVTRGQPDTQITSGSFAALIASQAIQFNSGLQMSYAQLCEDVGGMVIEMLQKFATTERVAKIVGKNKRYMLKSFSNKDIAAIKTVHVQIANPLTKTNAGRIKMAEDLLSKGLIHRPEQYQQVMETGKLEPMIENEQTALNNIRRENEMLRAGQAPIAVLTEDHRLHILEHASVIDNPDSKMDEAIRQATLQHIGQHITVWGQVPPELAMALGRQSLIPQMQPTPPGGGVSDMKQAQPGPRKDELPKDPNMPTNPMTGQDYNHVTGGL